MAKIVVKEQQARSIAERVPATSCATGHVKADGLLHEEVEIDIDRAGLRRGKVETLIGILYAMPEGTDEDAAADAEAIETEAASNATEDEADEGAEQEEKEDTGEAENAEQTDDIEAAEDADEQEATKDAKEEGTGDGIDEERPLLGDPIVADKGRDAVATVVMKVAVPEDEAAKTVKVTLTSVFDGMSDTDVAIAVVPYRSKKPVLAAVAALVLLAIVIGVIISNWGDPRARKGYYEGKSQEEIQADLDSQVDWYSMEISVAGTMKMYEGDTEVEARIENIAANHCDQKVKMYLTDDPDDVLYESGGISPGEYIQTVPLKHALPVGRHEVTVEFQGYEQNISLISDEGQLLGHDTFGASCAAQVSIEVLPR